VSWAPAVAAAGGVCCVIPSSCGLKRVDGPESWNCCTSPTATPVLYGRNLPTLGGPFQSAITDTPLVAWHEITPAVSRRAWSSRRLLSPRRPGTCACGTEPDRTALLRDLEGVDRCRSKTEIAARYRDGCRSKWRRRCLSSAAIRQMSARPGAPVQALRWLLNRWRNIRTRRGVG
jgi:hypothetical protein